jgi:cell division protein FtsQ
MARKSGPTISQEELYPLADEPGREGVRLLDLDVEQEAPFLRVQKRVSVRRGSLPKKTVTRLTWSAVALGVVFLCGMTVAALYHYGERSWRFRVESSDDIDISGLQNVTRAQVMEVMGGDIGRNIFFVPLAQRKAQLEQIPWVESASVMRFVPNRLKVEVHERTPVAFARVGTKIMLTDAAGTLMDLPGRKKYSFPVIVGMNNGEPPSTRAARMKIYNDVVSQLDAGGARYSQELSEIDLSDPDDVKVMANHHAGEVLVHLGSSSYLERYKIYVTHLQEWQQQFDKLESVDLRYDRQIIVNPDLQGPMKQPPLSTEAARKAMAAGVKPAALITHISSAPRPAPSLAVKTIGPAPAKPTPAKPAASVRTAKAAHHKSRTRRARASIKSGTKAKPGNPSAAKTQTKPALKSVAAMKPAAKPSPAIAKGEPQ